MNEIKINPEKLFTKKAYSDAFKISRPTIDKQIKDKSLSTIKVKGTILIIAK